MVNRPDQFSRFDADAALGTAPKVPDATTEEETVPKSRFDEVNTALQTERESRDNFVLGLINNRGGEGGVATPPEPAPSPADLIEDEEVREVLAPALEAARKQGAKEAFAMFEEKYGTVLETVAHNQAEESVGGALGLEGGMTPALRDKVKTAFWDLPEDQRANYDNQVGYELLARRVLDTEGTSQRREELGGMAHSAPFGSTPPAAPRGGGVSDEDAFAMTPEQWEDYKRDLRR